MTETRTFLAVDDARQAIMAAVGPGDPEFIEVRQAFRRYLAQPLRSKFTLPQDPVSVMDGFALRFSDVAAGLTSFDLVGESAAGHPADLVVQPSQAARISTGAVVPNGCDLVVAQEDTTVTGTKITIGPVVKEQAFALRFIRPAGSEVRCGEELLGTGHRLAAGDLALAAGTGNPTLPVFRQPQIAICSTGDELLPVGSTPGRGQIIETNCLMLATQIERVGGQALLLPPLPDEPSSLRAGLQQALAQAEMLITSGGISVGQHDIVLSTLLELGAEILFQKVRLQPGKPTTVLRCDGKLIFCLPGNPASALVAFELFARPAILRRLGVDSLAKCQQILELPAAQAMQADARRDHFVRVRLQDGAVWPLAQQASGSLASIAGHDGLARIPAGQNVAPGQLAQVWFMTL